ncbi:hypothetical protein IMG5_008860 [Ichthyophthirius multifiliis]|uniref:Senescence domain-containing protein n=1 Tax=Ichthyophthirius multifiliis TaxID=5932 RepID=G0QJT5_ICHMU|nr:hypothetical protein IMG5_008860 [Ichthyophthirius multifiliis]EGR34519.1 hypothetical protein IMG5_008860 [Ichthyophthirius multifiliis]|eukprot:XP_004039823.1 hypothetical protein IMG5_008860 [Ichthyophthirius multifiliis]
MDQILEGKILQEIKNTTYFRLLNNTRTKINEGTLQICILPDNDLTYLKLDDFYYTLQKQIKCISFQFQNYKTYIFPHTKDGFNALCIFQNELVIQQLEIILQNTVTFIEKVDLHILDEQDKNLINTHCVDIFDNPLMTEDKTIYYIKKGGEVLKDAFQWVGSITSKGVNIAGNYLNEKISKNKVEVSQETQQKYIQIKNTAQQTFKVTGEFLQSMLNPVVQATNQQLDKINKNIDNSDNQILKKIKNIGSATIDATSNAFDGLSQGASQVGDTLGQNTRNIAEKKLGEETSNTLLGETKK